MSISKVILGLAIISSLIFIAIEYKPNSKTSQSLEMTSKHSTLSQRTRPLIKPRANYYSEITSYKTDNGWLLVAKTQILNSNPNANFKWHMDENHHHLVLGGDLEGVITKSDDLYEIVELYIADTESNIIFEVYSEESGIKLGATAIWNKDLHQDASMQRMNIQEQKTWPKDLKIMQ